MRILKAIGVKQRRIIRVGLWGGHNGAGDSGHRSYVHRNYADLVTKEYKMDVYERLFPQGMMQATVVVAIFAYHAAMRDDKLPPHCSFTLVMRRSSS